VARRRDGEQEGSLAVAFLCVEAAAVAVPQRRRHDMSDTNDSENTALGRRALLAGTVAAAAGAGTLLASKPAAAQTCEPLQPGTREITFSVASNTSFGDLVGIMKEVLTLPELPGIKGCRPCLSGLDRFALVSRVLDKTR
jgi:hypothetical protein